MIALAANGVGEDQAFAQLRQLAMGWQMSVEDAARRINAMQSDATRNDGRGVA